MDVAKRSVLALLALFPLLCACGEESDRAPAEPSGEKVSGWEKPASDPGVASVQKFIQRRVETKEGEGRIDITKEGWRRGPFPLRPRVEFDAKRTYLWRLETSEGRLLLSLRGTTAPEHVSNVVYLTLLGFYDGIAFDSVVPGKSATAASRSPGYTLTGPELDPRVKHDRPGLLSAVSYGPGTDAAAFRLTFAADPTLDEHGTVYGEVVEGMDVLRRIEALGTPEGAPRKPVVIRSASLLLR
jgi:cyclophilin family peptidyl-prolyl cis-trans isomerase